MEKNGFFFTCQNKKRFLGSLFYGLKFNKKIRVSMCSQIRDFLYIDDLCVFIELLMKKAKSHDSESWVNTKIMTLSHGSK